MTILTFVGGAAAAFAVLHGLLYLFFPKTKANLHFALFAALLSGFLVAVAQTSLASDPEVKVPWQMTIGTCGVLMGLAGARFELSAFQQKAAPWLWALLAAGLAVLVRIWSRPDHYPSDYVNLFGLAMSVEMLRIAAVALYRRQPGVWVIGLGFAAMLATGLYTTANNLGWVPVFLPHLMPLGAGALMLSMSVYLSRDVARIHRDLERQLEEVRRGERQRAELEEARRFQISMLPGGRPELAHADVAFKMWTASEVGGDYYDYRAQEDGAVTLAIGDATGHGLRSGLMVAATKSLFQSGADAETLPEALARLSRGIRGMNLERMNFAMLLARVEGRSVRLASAGMPPALRYLAASGIVEEVMLPGPPLGTMVGFPYREETLELAPGDVVLMMTDGLPELADGNGDVLGYERVRELFRQAVSEPSGPPSPESLIGRVFESARQLAAAGPRDDDLTLAVVRGR